MFQGDFCSGGQFQRLHVGRNEDAVQVVREIREHAAAVHCGKLLQRFVRKGSEK